MSNKPVAWMETYNGEPNNLDWDKSNLYCEGEFHNVVPLQTHPVKELDEDFDSICLENKRLQAEIDSLKDKLMLAKQSLEIVEGWIKK